jgi:uncharacterized alkaline shock family protein YloU
MTDDLNLIELIENDVMSFDGVSRFPGIGFTGNLQKAMLGKDKVNPGVKLSEEDDGLIINCGIIVYFGVNIPQLCYDIQTKVKRDVEKTTGQIVKAVNIRVEGIDKAE